MVEYQLHFRSCSLLSPAECERFLLVLLIHHVRGQSSVKRRFRRSESMLQRWLIEFSCYSPQNHNFWPPNVVRLAHAITNKATHRRVSKRLLWSVTIPQLQLTNTTTSRLLVITTSAR